MPCCINLSSEQQQQSAQLLLLSDGSWPTLVLACVPVSSTVCHSQPRQWQHQRFTNHHMYRPDPLHLSSQAATQTPLLSAEIPEIP